MEITPATAEDLEILITFRDEASCWLRAWGHRPVVQPRENLLYGFKLPAPSANWASFRCHGDWYANPVTISIGDMCISTSR